MKTKDTDYGKFFPLDEGGFPEDYPYKESFYHHVQKMEMLLRYIKNPDQAEDEFLDMLEMLHQDGFTNFYNHCWKQYRDILHKRMVELEDSINHNRDFHGSTGGEG